MPLNNAKEHDAHLYGEITSFEDWLADKALPTALEANDGMSGGKEHCQESNCLWPCWHHVHDRDYNGTLEPHFRCRGSTLRMFADEGCAPCALLRHHCSRYLRGFCDSDQCYLDVDEEGLVTEVDVSRGDHLTEIEFCLVPESHFVDGVHSISQQPSSLLVPLPMHTQRGRIHENPRSESMITLLRTWLHGCLKRHGECLSEVPNTLPSRVLDLRASDIEDVVWLRQNEGLQGNYMALSYCWGGVVPPQTTRSNRESHGKGIVLSALPATYRDAIFVARQLYIPFLWIDSLCIVQDDDDDRTCELGKMDRTFRNAILVLIAASASNPSEGFLEPRHSDLVWSAASMIRLGDKRSHVVVSRKTQDRHRVNACESTAIDSRAWTFQERFLAQRCLVFRTGVCIWECRAGCECEYNLASGALEPQLLRLEDTRSIAQANLDAISYDIWLNAISQQYSNRQLTFAKDKLPAISALAQYIAGITHDTYFAGIWRRDIFCQLAWKPSTLSMEDIYERSSVQYVAPSWSWASWNGGVSFPQAMSLEPAYEPLVIDIVSETTPNDPYGAVDYAHIIIKGFACTVQLTLSWHAGEINEPSDRYLMQTLSLSEGTELQFAGFHSRPCHRRVTSVMHDDEPEKLMLQPAQESLDVACVGQEECSGEVILFWISCSTCLVLVPSLRIADSFERVGLVELNESVWAYREALATSGSDLQDGIFKLV